MIMKVSINHVFSNGVESKIFDDFFDYFSRLGSHKFSYLKSVSPINGALIRHYHRPNLEKYLINPCVVTVHHDLGEWDEWLQFDKFESQYKQADLIVCLNSSQKNFLEKRGIKNVELIPHGYDPRFLKPIQRKYDREKKIWLGLFSRRYPRKVKGEAYIYELSKRLNPDKFAFFMVGKGRSYDAAILEKYGFETRCYESLPYSVLCSAYSKIDFLLIASSHEGGPASLPEALATCTPVIANSVGMVTDFVFNKKNGIYLSMDPEFDAKTIEALCFNENLMKSMIDHAKDMQQQVNTWEEIILRYEDQYTRLLDGVAYGA